VLPEVHRFTDLVEVGTPLLKRFGLSAISSVRELAPGAEVVADSKTVDGGSAESAMLFGAGADVITLLSCAATATFDAVSEQAVRAGGDVLVDTVAEADPLAFAERSFPAGVSYLALHTSTDSRFAGDIRSSDSFVAAARYRGPLGLVLAGGIDRRNFEAAVDLQPEIIVVGRAIWAADDPADVAGWMREVLG
jgi:3-hexulose-6-phosphate synthase